MLKIGDVILYNYYDSVDKWYHKAFYKLQEIFDRGKAHHVAIYIGDGKILDTNVGVGVRIRKYYKNEGKQKILRVKDELAPTGQEFSLAINNYYEKHQGLKYSTRDYIKAILYKIFRLNFILKNSPIEDICSGLVYEIYNYLGFKKLIVTPNDFQRAKYFKIIKKWKDGVK